MSHRHRRAQFFAPKPVPAPVAIAPPHEGPDPRIAANAEFNFWRHEVQADRLRQIADNQSWALFQASLYPPEPENMRLSYVDRTYDPPGSGLGIGS